MTNEDRIVTLETYYDPMLAEIIRGKLEANNIPCFIADENLGTMYPIYNQAVGGVKLKVFEHDLEKCRQLLTEDNSLSVEDSQEEETGGDPAVCPHCGSTNVQYAQATEQRVGVLTALISLLMLVYPFYERKSWHCFNCSRDFNGPKPRDNN
jgi:hypothetical protein